MPNNRLKDGFATLEGGMNDGIASSLIEPNQVTFARDFTFRGSYARTREPFVNLPLTFDSDTTEANFTGPFQGACWYESSFGQSGFILSRGGRLFMLTLGLGNTIKEITPQAQVVTTQTPGATVGTAFTVPAENAQVLIYLTSQLPFTVGQNIVIDSGSYTVNDLGAHYILATYNSGAAHGTVVTGVNVQNNDLSFIYETELNPANFDFVYLFQAENYAIAMASQNLPAIYDGSTSFRASPGQIPAGIFGAYVWGRIWTVLPSRREFVAGDLVGSSSGTPAKGYVDAILEMTENTYLNGGGAFTTPSNRGLINGLAELAQVDTSLGTGNLMVGAAKSVFSVNTPVDRTTWQNLSYPIQTVSLVGSGFVGPRFMCDENNNLWFRSHDGIRSYKNARRQMNEEGNTPQSQEISNLLAYDDQSLLFYGSAMLFDNRLYFTASPYRDSVTGSVAHRGLAVMNLDMVSNLRTKLPSAWEGIYTGLNILQLVSADIDEKTRGFAFVLNGSDVELWEMGANASYDTFNDGSTVTRTPIQPVLETRAFNCGDGDTLKKLITASIYLDEMVDNVTLNIFYKPDQYPDWTSWATVNLCATVSKCDVQAANPDGSCVVWMPNKRQYAAKVKLPTPQSADNVLSQMPMSHGYEHQIRIEATGSFRLRKFIIECEPVSEPTTGNLPENVECQTVSGCDKSVFGYDSHG